MRWRRPAEGEIEGHFINYADLIWEEDALQVLKEARHASRELMFSLSLEQWDYAYQEGKWTIKEVWQHILDSERIFAYRALRIARNDQTPLPGFEQDDYILPSKARERSVAGIIHEYDAVRVATITLFEYMPAEALDHTGTASNKKLSARALAFIIAGHERHHIRGLRENYGVN
ncbi:MAG TPA: DinB family protein [Saprospiraceae bacterium]|nr:DinB family protein [Saprospiraceae bacterium]